MKNNNVNRHRPGFLPFPHLNPKQFHVAYCKNTNTL